MPIEPIQLDDRNFDQLFQEAVARIPVHTPLWTNFNESDPGITLVRLFAFMTENLLYRSNRIPEANRRKFITLLGIGLQPASPGLGIVSFRNDRGPLLAWPLEAGQEVRAGKVPFRTRTSVCILPVTAAAYYKKPQNGLDEATKQQYRSLFETFLEHPPDDLKFYQSTQLETPEIGKPLPMVDLADNVNGTIDRSLWVALVGPQNVPIDTVRAAIAGKTLTLGIYPTPKCAGQVLRPATSEDSRPVPDPGLVFEIAAPDPKDPSEGIGQARYERLTLDYADNVVEEPGIVQFRLPAFDKLQLWDFDPEEEGTADFPPLVEDKALAKRIATWIRIRLPKADDPRLNGSSPLQQQAQLTWVGTNAARVIQAMRSENELLGVGTGAPDQTYKVANTPVIVDTITSSATGEASSTFVLEVQKDQNTWEAWQMIDDLFAAKPTDRVYTLDPESGQVSFGNGLRGMRPPQGRRIRVSYEYGGGPEGQVAIGAINKSAVLPGGFKVENPLPTWGADAGEDVAEGERNISRYLRHRDRLVTINDFRDITLRTPGVDMGRVEVLPLFNPDRFDVNNPTQTWPGTVTVMVIPKFGREQPDAPLPDRLFLDAVCAWLDPRRLVTTEIHVRGPIYVPMWVSVGIVTMAGQMREVVQRNVRSALRDYLSSLVGGPPVVPEYTLDTDCPTDTTPSDPCAKPRGMGWPLSTEVRRQDLEAVATRVAGVRYVDSIKLGIVPTSGAMLTEVERVPLAGLQLPQLVTIDVREGAAEDPATLFGLQPTPATLSNLFPVPVLPKTC
jgi:Baseplate J-like protein